MDKEISQKKGGKAKLFLATGAVCAMGGYICGDKVDEMDKLEKARQPYEIASSLLADATKKTIRMAQNPRTTPIIHHFL